MEGSTERPEFVVPGEVFPGLVDSLLEVAPKALGKVSGARHGKEREND